jgi:hypothetical protein
MRMLTKARLFFGVYMLGGLAVLGASLEYFSQGVALTLVLGWFVVFGVLQFLVFRCGHCGRLAIKTPSGAYVPWVGTHCQYCRQEY